jgi:hypothetical protein
MKPVADAENAKLGAGKKGAVREDEGIQYINVANWDSETEEAMKTTSRIGGELNNSPPGT